MELGKVIGSVWATKKDESLSGEKLLIVRAMGMDGHIPKAVTVAADIIGAGVGDTVLVVYGSSARFAVKNTDHPVDAAIVGIVDSIVVEDKT